MRTLSVIQVGGGSGAGAGPRSCPGAGVPARGLVDAPAARDWVSTELGVPVVRTLEQALKTADADAVLLVSPPVTHRALAETAVAGVVTCSSRSRSPSRSGTRRLSRNRRERPPRDGGAELPLPAAVAGAAGPRSAARSAGSAGSGSPAGATCATPGSRARLAWPDAAPVPAGHGDPPRRPAAHDHGPGDRRSRRARLEGPRRAVQVRADRARAARPRRRDARRLRGRLGAAGSETSWNGDWELIGERPRRPGQAGSRRRCAGGVVLEPTARRGCGVPADAPCARPARSAPRAAACPRRRTRRSAPLPTTSGASPRSSRIARSTESDGGRGAGVKIGLFLALFHDRSLDEALAAAPRLDARRSRSRRRGPHAGPRPRRRGPRTRARDLRPLLPREPAASRREVAAARPTEPSATRCSSQPASGSRR